MIPFYRTAKFWMAIVTGLLIVANEGLNMNIPADIVLAFAALVISYILGESAVESATVIRAGRVEVARMNNIARLEETRIMASACPDLVAASRRHETIEDEANKNL